MENVGKAVVTGVGITRGDRNGAPEIAGDKAGPETRGKLMI